MRRNFFIFGLTILFAAFAAWEAARFRNAARGEAIAAAARAEVIARSRLPASLFAGMVLDADLAVIENGSGPGHAVVRITDAAWLSSLSALLSRTTYDDVPPGGLWVAHPGIRLYHGDEELGQISANGGILRVIPTHATPRPQPMGVFDYKVGAETTAALDQLVAQKAPGIY